MEQALSLSEIRIHICLFIQPRDYSSCALVSRAWFESIAPRIWHSATLCEKEPIKDLAILHKYRGFVRALNLDKLEVLIKTYGWFDNLRAIHFKYGKYQSEAPEHITDLIRRNQSSLQRIHIDSYCDDNSIVIREIHGCLSLKHLHHGQLKLQERDVMESFMMLCNRLTTLSLRNVGFEEGTNLMLKDQIFTGLERFEINYVQGPYLDFVKVCPNLKVLILCEILEGNDEEFVEVITTHCKQLCVLSYRRPSYFFTDELVRLALNLPPMKYLQVDSLKMFAFVPPSTYSRHYETLQAIQMVNRSKKDGKDVQTILSSCPNLRWFEGTFILAKDIESGPPWVCQGLEHLRVGILVCDDAHRLGLVACAQLSQLKKLRTLNLSMKFWGYHRHYQHRSLSLRLGEGLELLESLSKLEHFGVGYLRSEFRAEWQTEDIEWMAQAWPNLEAIYGEYHEMDGIYSRICKQMGASRVLKRFPDIDYLDFIDL